MHLEGVIAALAPADVLRLAPVEISDLAYDAGHARPGSLFFCVPGARADGHEFAVEAVENGAVALVVEQPLALEVPQLVVDSARRAMAVVAVELNLRGHFNAENALGALAAARLLGIEHDAIVRGLESVRGVPGRFESVAEGQPFDVIVDYSHKPDALESVLRTAREMTTGRVICVFGCGGDRDRGKRPLMGRIASQLADVAILTSDNPRSEDPLAIIDEVLAGVTGEIEVEPDRAAAIEQAIAEAREGDVVLIAGKGHEQGQEFADRTIPFDDREVARDAIRH